MEPNKRQRVSDNDPVSAALALLDELPQLPAAVQQLFEALSDDDIDRKRLAGIIDQCPSLAGKLVGLANSAYFRRAAAVNAVSDAIFVIGFRTVRSLATATALQEPFDHSRCPAFRPGRFWLHAVLTAQVARELASKATTEQSVSVEDAYLGGLLHGIGLLAMVHLFPEPMQRILEQAGPEANVAAAMGERFGVTHQEIGAALLRRWHLPEAFTTATGHYADPGYHGVHWPLCRVIAVAHDWAERVIHRDDNACFDQAGLRLLGIAQEEGEAVSAACLEQLEPFMELSEMISGEKPVFLEPEVLADAAGDLKDRLVDTIESLSSLAALTNLDIQARDERTVLKGALRVLMENQNMQRCSIFLLQEGELVNAAGLSWVELNAPGGELAPVADSHRFDLGEGLIGLAAETGELQHCRDCSVDPRFACKEPESGSGPGSLISVPVRFQEQTLGVLNISHRQANVFSGWDERFLAVFCNMLGQLLTSNRLLRDMEHAIEQRTLELQVALERAESLSILDSLTGVHNRRYFISNFTTLIEQCARYGHKMALLMIDIDDFKLINDTFGHLEGDRVLRAVASVLGHCARGADIIARFGGEEFVIAVQDTDCDGANRVAGRIQEHIRSLSCGQGERQRGITASIGITCYRRPGRMPVKTPEQWIQEADDALYRAKRAGKNRVSVHVADN